MRFEIRYWDELVPAEELLVSFAAEAAAPEAAAPEAAAPDEPTVSAAPPDEPTVSAAPPDEPTASAAPPSPASDAGPATSELCAHDLAPFPPRRGAAVTAP